MSAHTGQSVLKAAEQALRTAAARYQGDTINREALLQARAHFRKCWKAVQS